MTRNKVSEDRLTVTELEEFLRNPPVGFSVEALRSGYRVHNQKEEENLVLLDDFTSCTGHTVVFQKSLGRNVKMRNLWEYTSMRKSLLSKRIYVLVSACRPHSSGTGRKSSSEPSVLRQFVVCIDGSDPFTRWQMEDGLDRTIASVAGESYRVDIDLTAAVRSWADKHLPDQLKELRPVWRDASFTLKYYSDALFDFPHWFGFSKRQFELRLTRAC